jgi:transposase-like protein
LNRVLLEPRPLPQIRDEIVELRERRGAQTMKRSRFSDEQIIGILKEHQAGLGATELCRKHGVSDATFYKWRVA